MTESADNLLATQARVCYTAVGCLVHQGKVLLVKHKKLGWWLNPGGHIEAGELPHQTAEREFWEETGLRVRAYSPFPLIQSSEHVYLPSPFVSVVHWVSQDNYRRRLAGQTQPDAQSQWQRGCERHLNLLYLVAPMPDEKLQLKLNAAETDGIQWFSLAELETLDTDDGIKKEVRLAFQLEKDYDKYYPQSN